MHCQRPQALSLVRGDQALIREAGEQDPPRPSIFGLTASERAWGLSMRVGLPATLRVFDSENSPFSMAVARKRAQASRLPS